MERPRIVVYSVATVDGRVSLGADRLILHEPHAWKALSGPSVDAVHQQILAIETPQAILEGSGTFVRDGDAPSPLPPVVADTRPLFSDYLPEEVVHRHGHAGWYVIVDSRGRCRWEFKEQNGWHLLILVARATPPEYLAYLRSKAIPYLVVGTDRVNLHQAVRTLADQLGIGRVLSESGGSLNGALLRAGLLDEVNVVVIPALVAGSDTPTVFDAPELKSGESPTRLALVSAVSQPDGNVWLRYQVEQ